MRHIKFKFEYKTVLSIMQHTNQIEGEEVIFSISFYVSIKKYAAFQQFTWKQMKNNSRLFRKL